MVQVTGAGSFSASLKFGAQTVGFAGAFDSRGRFAGEIVRAGQPSLRLVLALDVTDGSERLTGLISDDTTTAAINAERMISAAPRPGKYTAVLERDAASSTLPAGFGYGTLRVGTGGDVRFAGRLGDGDAVTLGGQLTKSAQWPVYASLNGDAGALIGRVNFRDIPQTSDLDGRLHWLRPNGSEGDVVLTGSAYARPASGRRILGLAGGRRNAHITFSDGPLTSPVARKLKITPSHQVTPMYPGIFTMTLDAGVGTFSGKMKFGGIGKVKFDGVLLPKIGVGKGQVRFSDEIGKVEVAGP